MREKIQFPIPSIVRRRSAPQLEIDSLLDAFDLPALLIDSYSSRVVQCNSLSCDLLQLPKEVIIGSNVRTVLPNWTMPGPIKGSPSQSIIEETELIQRNQSGQSTIPVTCEIKKISRDNPYQVIIITPIADSATSVQAQYNIASFTENIQKVFVTYQNASPEEKLDRLISNIPGLTNAAYVALYISRQDQPVFIKLNEHSTDLEFPSEISPQDLIQHNTAKIWYANERSLSRLHRFGRSNQLRYIASAPIGRAPGFVGLLVIADSSHAPMTGLIENCKAIADAVSATLEEITLKETIQDQLEKLAHLQNLYTALQSSYQDGVIYLSPSLSILGSNSTVDHLLGFISTQFINQPIFDILISADINLNDYFSTILIEQTTKIATTRIYQRSGDTIITRLAAYPIFYRDELDGIFLFICDLSEQEQIKEQSVQLEERALLGEVTAIFAHEVRNPINNLSTGLELMALSQVENRATSDLISRMQQDCDRVAELTKSVLSFSRKAEYVLEPIDISLLIQRLLDRLAQRIVNAKVEQTITIERDCPYILGDTRALEQVFNNLIINAIQAMGSNGGKLAIKVQKTISKQDQSLDNQARYVEVTVADNGPGIPKEIQEKVFQPFFTTHRDGTGIGLAVSKQIITAHKGTIKITSMPGGTVFHVFVPTIE